MKNYSTKWSLWISAIVLISGYSKNSLGGGASSSERKEERISEARILIYDKEMRLGKMEEDIWYDLKKIPTEKTYEEAMERKEEIKLAFREGCRPSVEAEAKEMGKTRMEIEEILEKKVAQELTEWFQTKSEEVDTFLCRIGKNRLKEIEARVMNKVKNIKHNVQKEEKEQGECRAWILQEMQNIDKLTQKSKSWDNERQWQDLENALDELHQKINSENERDIFNTESFGHNRRTTQFQQNK